MNQLNLVTTQQTHLEVIQPLDFQAEELEITGQVSYDKMVEIMQASIAIRKGIVEEFKEPKDHAHKAHKSISQLERLKRSQWARWIRLSKMLEGN